MTNVEHGWDRRRRGGRKSSGGEKMSFVQSIALKQTHKGDSKTLTNNTKSFLEHTKITFYHLDHVSFVSPSLFVILLY